jgi:hypothetical protein
MASVSERTEDGRAAKLPALFPKLNIERFCVSRIKTMVHAA